MVDSSMLPWESSDAIGYEPVLDVSSEESAVARGKGCNCAHCLAENPSGLRKHSLEDYDNIDTEAELSDDMYFVCSYYVYGYVFSARKWGKRADRKLTINR